MSTALHRVPLVVLSLLLACSGGDDDSDDGGDGGDDGGEGVCAGEVSGAVSATFSDCLAIIVHYPDGNTIIDGRNGWVFSLNAVDPGAELEPPLLSLGMNLEVAGAPEEGTFTLTDAVPGVTLGSVQIEGDIFYDDLTSATLIADSIDEVTDQIIEGGHVITSVVTGSLEMDVSTAGGESVTVVATF